MSVEPSLADHYRGVVCDLDGVVYRGAQAVPGAVEALSALTIPIVWATNNASRPPEEVAAHLRSLGLTLLDASVLTSSLAGAAQVATMVPPGTAVLAVGGEGVARALEIHDLRPIRPKDHAAGVTVEVVLQGYGAEVTAGDLGEAAYAIEGGARWVATNDDATLPTERGEAPGNGALVGAVRVAVGVEPIVVGKPHPPMYQMAARALGVETAEVLAIGDRLQTDIAGAHSAGTASALVLTGVHNANDAAAAPPEQRPDYLLRDCADLHRPYPVRRGEGGTSRRGDALAVLDLQDTGGLVLEGGTPIDRARSALDVLWWGVDEAQITPEQAAAIMRRSVGTV
ncbi:HAD-IIA family hydrolase [Janibacter sp. GXQ6167]|uniref:HAD-IIA family hydrolase n=1 Tax=Janibacter sp. GXQ6167 TaxID=3240791 RepID=UPI0035233030